MRKPADVRDGTNRTDRTDGSFNRSIHLERLMRSVSVVVGEVRADEGQKRSEHRVE